MTERIESTRKHLADMLAVESHILQAVEQQLESTDELRKHADAGPLLRRIDATLRRHRGALEAKLDTYDGEIQGTLKQLITDIFGSVAGLYDRLREHPLSRMLRDDYTALSLAAMSYTMLHTYALAVKDEHVAKMALDHLGDLTSIIMGLAELIPAVVVLEVADEAEYPVDTSVAAAAISNTQATWSAPTST